VGTNPARDIARGNQELSKEGAIRQLSRLYDALVELPEWHKEMIKTATSVDINSIGSEDDFIKDQFKYSPVERGLASVPQVAPGYAAIAGKELKADYDDLSKELMPLSRIMTNTNKNKDELSKNLEQMEQSPEKDLILKIIKEWDGTSDLNVLEKAHALGAKAEELLKLRTACLEFRYYDDPNSEISYKQFDLKE
jgi:hypothetical protein